MTVAHNKLRICLGLYLGDLWMRIILQNWRHTEWREVPNYEGKVNLSGTSELSRCRSECVCLCAFGNVVPQLFSSVFGIGPKTAESWYHRGLRTFEQVLSEPSIRLNRMQTAGKQWCQSHARVLSLSSFNHHLLSPTWHIWTTFPWIKFFMP